MIAACGAVAACGGTATSTTGGTGGTGGIVGAGGTRGDVPANPVADDEPLRSRRRYRQHDVRAADLPTSRAALTLQQVFDVPVSTWGDRDIATSSPITELLASG
jgi:hypothetical protein